MRVRSVPLPPNPSRLWKESSVRQHAKRTLEEIGVAWGWMTPRVRQALVSEAVLAMVRGLDRAAVPVEAIDVLYADMLTLMPIDE